MTAIHVMQVVDSLAAGGMERMAVTLANTLDLQGYRSSLCATRHTGTLAQEVAQSVNLLDLGRSSTLDLHAVLRLARTVKTQRVDILHAHGSAIFFTVLVAVLCPSVRVIWHDHFGRYLTEERSKRLYRLAIRRTAGVITVNQPLLRWAVDHLGIPESRVWYVPNFVRGDTDSSPRRDLAGHSGSRIVCVANLRPEKDHPTLIQAFARVVAQNSEAHLFLAGQENDPAYVQALRRMVTELNLAAHVSFLGSVENIPALLKGCDIGILTSRSEGLPLALLEYGAASLPAIATSVGQCTDVLEQGKCGILLPPECPERVAESLLLLLSSPEQRQSYGERLHARIRSVYSQESVITTIEQIYRTVLESGKRGDA